MEKRIEAGQPAARTAHHALRTEVAWGCRILAMGDHADLTLGHLSARTADSTILIKRKGLALHEVGPDDVLEIDLDGTKLAGDGGVHLESSLHTEIYKSREDVGSVVHTHPPYATALGASDGELQMLTHDAVLFHDGLPRFEGTAELITEQAQGRAIATALGDQRALLMQNHGVIVVGKDVPWAVIAALILERSIQFQALAAQLGSTKPMTDEMAHRLHPTKYRDDFIEDYWLYLKRESRRRGLATGLPARD